MMIVSVVSGIPQVGKSLIARNLAAILEDSCYLDGGDADWQERLPEKNVVLDCCGADLTGLAFADYVLVVMEPTESAVEVLADIMAQVQEKPVGVLINKGKLGQNLIMTYCRKEKIKLLGLIPVSKEVAKLQEEGQLLVDQGHYWTQYFQNIAYQISGGEEE